MSSGTQGPNSLIGRAVGGYRLTSLLGTGATGAVFLGQRLADTPRVIERTQALPVELPDEAAIKVLIVPWHLDEHARADFNARFIREAQTLRRLRHPNIVSVLDYGDDPAAGFTYMTLPYMAGGTLAARLAARSGPLPLDEIARDLSQVAAALDYAHSQGIVHRDIKPANILLDGQGQAYVSDFSIVRVLVETQSRLTSTGRVMGTPEYMAPEQIGGREVGAPADIYGLGMVAYALVTGNAAFSATSMFELIRLQTQEPPPLPRTLRPDLPEPAEAAILRALAKDPTQRFPTAAAFAQAFADGLQGQWADGLMTYMESGARLALASEGQTMPNVVGTPTQPALRAQASATQPAGGPRRRNRLWPLGVATALLLTVACMAVSVFAVPGSPLHAMLSARLPTSGASAQAQVAATHTAAPNGSRTTTAHATATPKKSSVPTATVRIAPPAPTPIPLGTVLYQADWSQGMDGWKGNSHWSVQGGNLVNDGTDDNSTHYWPSIISPYTVTQTKNYAVETTIQMTTQGANAQCFDVGSVRGARLANGEWQSYIAAYCTPLGLTIGVVNGATTHDLMKTPFSPGYTPHVYRFEAIGSTLSLYADGQLMMTVNDTTYPSGGGGGLNTYNTGVIVSSYDIIYE